MALALQNVSDGEMARVALRFAADRHDVRLDEAARKVLEVGDPPSNHQPGDPPRFFAQLVVGHRLKDAGKESVKIGTHRIVGSIMSCHGW